MKELEKCAEILVECGYAEELVEPNFYCDCHQIIVDETGLVKPIPFSDTLEGRRQADAIENHIRDSTKGRNLWSRSYIAVEYKGSHHQHRLDRIKWCIQQLVSDKATHQQENEAMPTPLMEGENNE